MHENFASNFMQLLNNKMCTLSSSFVDIVPKMTKLCSIRQDNRPFLRYFSSVAP